MNAQSESFRRVLLDQRNYPRIPSEDEGFDGLIVSASAAFGHAVDLEEAWANAGATYERIKAHGLTPYIWLPFAHYADNQESAWFINNWIGKQIQEDWWAVDQYGDRAIAWSGSPTMYWVDPLKIPWQELARIHRDLLSCISFEAGERYIPIFDYWSSRPWSPLGPEHEATFVSEPNGLEQFKQLQLYLIQSMRNDFGHYVTAPIYYNGKMAEDSGWAVTPSLSQGTFYENISSIYDDSNLTAFCSRVGPAIGERTLNGALLFHVAYRMRHYKEAAEQYAALLGGTAVYPWEAFDPVG